MPERTTIHLGELRDTVEERLEYGDSIGEWVRGAIRMRLELENDEDPELTDVLEETAE